MSKSDFLTTLTEWVDENLRLVRTLPYIVFASGLAVAARRIRIAKSFQCVSDIPTDFFHRQLWLRGKIEDVRGPLLLIRHVPIWERKSWNKNESTNGCLNVSLFKVKSDGGFETLKSSFVNNQVWFKLISKNELDMSQTSTDNEINLIQCANCVVTMRPSTFSRKVVVNELVLKEGLGFIDESLTRITSKRQDMAFVKRLQNAQNKAQKKKIGIWKNSPLNESLKTSLFGKLKRLVGIE